MGKNLRFVILLLMVFGVYLVLRGKAAPVPAVFDKTVTLAGAAEASTRSGMPVLAFVTADWCGPCQALKRTALADNDVTEWIRTSTHPVYVDATNGVPAEAQGLGVQRFPTMILLRGGKEVSRLVGNQPTSSVLGWLQANSGAVADFKASGGDPSALREAAKKD